METTYHTVQADEITLWAERIKSHFQGKTLYLAIRDEPFEQHLAETYEVENGNGGITDFADRDGLDETEYLMRSPANRDYLLRAIQDVNEGKNLIKVPMEDLFDLEKLREYAKRAERLDE
jgi:hypothetical protein